MSAVLTVSIEERLSGCCKNEKSLLAEIEFNEFIKGLVSMPPHSLFIGTPTLSLLLLVVVVVVVVVVVEGTLVLLVKLGLFVRRRFS